MTRLIDLVAGFADVLQVPAGTVKNTAAVLWVAGLISTGPRGPGARHMTPADATNLLLALMYDDAQDTAATNVPLLRSAALMQSKGIIGFDYGGGNTSELPQHDFVSNGAAPYNLGDVLDRIFDGLVRDGTIDWDLEDTSAQPTDLIYVSNFSLTVSRPGYAAQMYLDAHAVHWNLNYAWSDPEHEQRRAAAIARGELPQHHLAHLGTYMSRSRSIADSELAGLADVLRGAPFDKGNGEEVPHPYEWDPKA